MTTGSNDWNWTGVPSYIAARPRPFHRVPNVKVSRKKTWDVLKNNLLEKKVISSNLVEEGSKQSRGEMKPLTRVLSGFLAPCVPFATSAAFCGSLEGNEAQRVEVEWALEISLFAGFCIS